MPGSISQVCAKRRGDGWMTTRASRRACGPARPRRGRARRGDGRPTGNAARDTPDRWGTRHSQVPLRGRCRVRLLSRLTCLDASPTPGVAVSRADAEPPMDRRRHAMPPIRGRFDGILAWDSFFHLRPDDQRGMFRVFADHGGRRAVPDVQRGTGTRRSRRELPETRSTTPAWPLRNTRDCSTASGSTSSTMPSKTTSRRTNGLARAVAGIGSQPDPPPTNGTGSELPSGTPRAYPHRTIATTRVRPRIDRPTAAR